jgi:replicative DNA helicase
MNYLLLIKYLFNYDLYIKYRAYIEIEKDLKEIYYLFKALDNIFEVTKQTITFEDYALWVQVNLGNDYTSFLEIIKNEQILPELLQNVLTEIKERNLAYKIAQMALKVSEGKGKLAEIDDLYREYESQGTIASSKYVSQDIEEIYNDSIKTPGIKWRLESLNKSLGPLRKGDFGFIFARPETGKTTFLASEVTFFASQVKSPILWINNEEQGNKVILRCYQAALGIRTEQLAGNLKEIRQQYKDLTNDNIYVYDNASTNKREVEAICKELQPSLIVFDQLHKVKGFTNDRDDLRLGAIFGWAREIAKEYAPVIAVNQADGSGENKKYLTMENVSGSKTAIQAEADWILGIGKIHDPGFEFIRFLNISKNKLVGDENTKPKDRHGRFDVLIEPEIARYKDL